MEIDPRLRTSGENHNENNGNPRRANGGSGGAGAGAMATHAYGIQVASTSSSSPPGTTANNDYPDLPSHHMLPGHSLQQQQVHDTNQSSNRNVYYAAKSQTYSGDVTAGATQSVFSTDPNNPFAELKRPRACEACRQLKVRCEPDPDADNNPNSSGTCKRCAKAGRVCVVTMPTRKRQKKTDSRVAELERRIDALTASLQASRSHDVSLLSAGDHSGRRWLGGAQSQRAPSVSNSVGSPASLAGNKRRYSGEIKDPAPSELLAPVYPRPGSPSTERMRHHRPSSAQWRSSSYASDGGDGARSHASHEFADAIDRGVVDVDTASKAFDRYVNDMAPILPAVVFPPGTKMGDVRRTKPALFHAILAASIGTIKPSVQLGLFNDLYRMLAERIFVKSEKVLEIIQALIVSFLWYNPPDHFEELKFYQLSHMAVILAMDLGMNRRMSGSIKPLSIVRDAIGKKPPLCNPDSPETRRTWLSCYFISVLSSVALRRIILVRWQPYMDECIEILDKSPDALPSDKRLIHWVKLCHLMEDIGSQFAVDYPCSAVSLSNPNTQYTLQSFEKQLSQWKKEVPPEFYSALLEEFEHNLYIHIYEVAMYADSDSDTHKPANGDGHARPISTAQVNALTNCLASIHQTLDISLSIDVKTVLCMPTIGLARTSYAAVSLIKLYSLVTSPESGITHVLDPDSLKVEYYLDRIIEHYKAAGELGGGRTPARFSVVLTMLRNWFVKRREQSLSVVKEGKDSNELVGDEGEGVKQQVNNNNNNNTGQTPLHLLSEVAMGDPNRPNPTQFPNPQPGYSQSPTGAPVVPTASSSSDLISRSMPTTTTAESESWIRFPPIPPASSRTFYPTFNHHSQPQSQPQQQHQLQDLSGYTNTNPSAGDNSLLMSSMAPQPLQMAGFIPDLDMQQQQQQQQGGLDPEHLFALGSMVDDGFFGLFPSSYFDVGGNGYGNWYTGF